MFCMAPSCAVTNCHPRYDVTVQADLMFASFLKSSRIENLTSIRLYCALQTYLYSTVVINKHSSTLLPMLHPLFLLATGHCIPRLRRHNTTPSPLRIPPRLLRILIINQQLSVLIIPMRHLLRNLHHVKRIRRLVENLIHFLERAVRRLGEEEVHAGHHEGVYDGEDDVGLVADVCEGGRRDHYDHEVEDPVCGCGDCICGGADGEGRDFGGVEPGHAEPADGEEGVEDEEEDSLVGESLV